MPNADELDKFFKRMILGYQQSNENQHYNYLRERFRLNNPRNIQSHFPDEPANYGKMIAQQTD